MKLNMFFIKKKFAIIFFIIFLLSLTFVKQFIYAEDPSPTPTNSTSSDLQNKINDLKGKISELQGKAKTLFSQISIMDNQIKLTEARIEANKEEIVNLILDIDTANKKISTLQKSLDKLTEVLLRRIVATYQAGGIKPLEMLLSSGNAPSLLTKLNYLKVAQAHDKRLIYDVQQAKNDYANQKDIFENKKKKVESLKAQLEQYNAQLFQEKTDKNTLLVATKNDELTYQQKLQAALAEQQAIAKIAAGGGNAVSVGKIKEGDLIGYMISGKSACSSGTHLHFEAHKDNSYQDPSGYLSNKSVIFENSPDGQFSFGGSWRWPLEDTILIEQGYGMTYWARIGWYGGEPHTGLDLYSSSSLATYSVKDGELFRGSISCGGGQMLFARVDHSEGIQTFYLHIMPNN